MTRLRRYFQFKDGHRPFNETSCCINFLLLIKHETVAEFRELYYRYFILKIYRFLGFAMMMRQLLRHLCEACSPTVGCRRAAAAVRESSVYSDKPSCLTHRLVYTAGARSL
jgi:hypothetical protein